jgi:hypothetical protein
MLSVALGGIASKGVFLASTLLQAGKADASDSADGKLRPKLGFHA